MDKHSLPTGITKRLCGTAAYAFTAEDLDPNAPSPRVPTCSRCFHNIARRGVMCDKAQKPETACGRCVSGHRGNCTLVGEPLGPSLGFR